MNGEYKRKLSSGIKLLTLSALLVLVMSGCSKENEESNEALNVSTQTVEKVNVPEPLETPSKAIMETLSPQPSVATTPEVEVSEASDPEEITVPEPSPAPMSVDEMKSYFGEFQISDPETKAKYIDVYRKLADDEMHFIKPGGKQYRISIYENIKAIKAGEKQGYEPHWWVYYLFDMDKDGTPEFGMWNKSRSFYVFKYEDEANTVELCQEMQRSFFEEQWETLILYTEEAGYSYNELFEVEAPCENCYWISQRFFKDRTAIETEGIRLTWEDLSYLTDICRVMPCFENQDALNENYYLGLINLSVSGPLGWAADEIVIIEEMEDYGCSSCAKISREEMENYVRNILGTELPIYGPSKQEMLENETNFFYEDGYYYIGVFDWLDIGYDYLGYEVKENGNVIVEFAMYEAIDDLSAVLELAPAENENGYIIVSYRWLDTQR